MAFKKGFKIHINNDEYLVRCDFANGNGKRSNDYSCDVHLRVSVFDKNGKLVKFTHDSYLQEKISDFICNCVNGQDTLYWDWNGVNRHLYDPLEEYLKCE